MLLMQAVDESRNLQLAMTTIADVLLLHESAEERSLASWQSLHRYAPVYDG